MTFDELQTIIQQISDSNIREIELDYQGMHLYLNKNKTSHQPVVTANQKPISAEVVKGIKEVKSDQPAKLKTSQPAQKPATIKAPLVGVIYLQPTPDKPAYKKVGDHVNAGEVVCVIEAMKMMTEIKSKVTGTISKILVDNEEVVEFDQPLFEVTQ
ncbi:acetyl-CoA carboxylase biotin carboxyl carrier protein [Secundilactobacillus hailunensis]|uniref:Biotin carboxyl carrier protein of acetyl-CoA carboxylase n=1 Tax=Secundilactobacillus hailunensis TaxID=2559923 RepID=A0ABW1TCX4_9LACO|nr:acetyl-CoA carboxylase biotin carboxyl carrier protein [Secundilactobacillus hailunensis]